MINEWQNAGLRLPSIIRVHKIATLEKDMVELVMGQIDKQTKDKVKWVISTLID